MIDQIYDVTTRKSGTVRTTLHPLHTRDGLDISVSRLARPDATDSVLLIHGLTTSSDMFVMPEHYGLAAFLHDQGFDVWLADFRMSNHHAYNITGAYTFDDIAVHDWPLTIDFIRKAIGPKSRLHVIAHCLGSATFHLALYGKTITGITSVVSNAVSLNPRVHPWAMLKICAFPFVAESILRLPYLDPRWADARHGRAPWLGRLVARLVGAWHLECNNDACNLVSFTWGSGHPAIFQHDKMARATHDRLADLFGPIAMPYFRNVRAGLLANNTFVRYGKKPDVQHLPERALDNVGEVRVPTLLMAGAHNNIFPGANRLTHQLISARGVPGYEYRELPDYGHQDVFMGQRCDVETFPAMVNFIHRIIAAS